MEKDKKIKALVLLQKSLNLQNFKSLMKEKGAFDLLDISIVKPAEISSKELLNEAKGAKILGVNWGMSEKIEEILDSGESEIEWIHTFSAGVDAYMTPKIKEHPSILTNTKKAYSLSLSEFVIFGMLYFEKKAQLILKAKSEKKWRKENMGILSKKTLGITGFGEIGSECAKRAKYGFDMKIIAMKKHPDKVDNQLKDIADEVIGLDQFDYLLENSDFVLNVLPSTKETRNLFGKREFEKMKKEAVFINVGRGDAVVEEDLIDCLKNKEIKGAVLDVFRNEPEINKEFYELENLYLSSHCGNCYEDMEGVNALRFVENVQRFLEREELQSIVDKNLEY